jgi:hypothetical protein
MSLFYKHILIIILIFAGTGLQAQTIVKGKILDASTKEPITGATIHCTKPGCKCGCTTNTYGEFEMKCTDCQNLSVSSVGYKSQQFAVATDSYIITLNVALRNFTK